MRARYEFGFWWWYDHEIRDWRIGCAPSVQTPSRAGEP